LLLSHAERGERRGRGGVLHADGERFILGAGTTDGYVTQPTSLARDRGLNNTGSTYVGGGPDCPEPP